MSDALLVAQETPPSMSGRYRLGKLRAIIRKEKDKPCMDCGKTFPYAQMSYDHCRGKKRFNLGGSLRGYDETDVRREIAKCDVVCLICHAARETKRREAKKKGD